MRKGGLWAMLCWFAGCMGGTGVSDGELKVTEIRLVNYGLFRETEVTHVREAKEGEQLVGDKLVEIRKEHVRTTDQIEARKGVLFGIEFAIIGEPTGSEVEIDVVHEHPTIEPPSGPTYGTQNYTVKRRIGEAHHALYMIEEDWEVVTGPWTIQIRCQGKKLLEKKLELVKAR